MVAEVQSSISDDVAVVDFLLELSVSEVVTDAEHLSSQETRHNLERMVLVVRRGKKGAPDFYVGGKINRR